MGTPFDASLANNRWVQPLYLAGTENFRNKEAMAHGVFRLAKQPASDAAMDTVLDARAAYLLAALDSIHSQSGLIKSVWSECGCAG